MSGALRDSDIEAEVRATLLERALPEGMWGHWWISEEDHDTTPRAFVTAMVVLSFTMFRETSNPLDSKVEKATWLLERRLLGSPNPPELLAAAGSAAVLSAAQARVGVRMLRWVGAQALRYQPDITDLGVYFYDYKVPPGAPTKKSHDRDYFITPTSLLWGIAGYQSKAPGQLLFRAIETLEAVASDLKRHDYVYMPEQEQLVASKNQAWAALLLRSAVGAGSGRVPGRFLYGLKKHRANVFLDTWWPPLALLSTTVFATGVATGAAALPAAFATASGLLVAGIHGKEAFRKLLVGGS
jgi:hypothetical protein